MSYPLRDHLESLRGHAPWKAHLPHLGRGRLLIEALLEVDLEDLLGRPWMGRGFPLGIERHEVPLGNRVGIRR